MGGGKSGSSGTTYTQSQTQIPPEVLARYNAVNARAETTANTPWQAYGGEFVAPVNQTQTGGINAITGAAGTDTPYFNQATNVINQALPQTQQLYGTAAGQSAAGYGQGTALTQQGIGTAGAAAGAASPYNGLASGQLNSAYSGTQPINNAALGLAAGATGAVNAGNLDINKYMSPYNEAVVQSTLGNLRQEQGMAQADLQDSQILGGSFGGDRSGVGRANMQRQQDMAYGQVASQLYNANYGQALGAAQQQQGVNLGADQANRAALASGAQNIAGIGNQMFGQGAAAAQGNLGIGQQIYGQGQGLASAQMQGGNQLFQQGQGAASTNAGLASGMAGSAAGTAGALGQLGTQQQQNQLAQGQAQIGAGSVQQQTQQAQDTAMYNQFLQEKGYPFQVAQFLANIAMGTGAQSGSTTNTTQGSPTPFFSDERLKENVHVIGKTNDGQPIIRFNYKGDKSTQIGLSAQETEKHHPDAVGLASGYKTVDYDAATRDSIAKAGGGGLTAGGGAGTGDYFAQLLQQQRAMYPFGDANARGIPTGEGGAGPHGIPTAQLRAQAIKPHSLPSAPQQQQPSGLKQMTDSVTGMYGAGKNIASAYGEGKDALFGTAAKTNAAGTQTAPATGGLLGTGGKYDWQSGWMGKQLDAGTPTPTPTASAPTAAAAPLDIGGANDGAEGLASGVSDLGDYSTNWDGFYAEGGKVKGVMPYGNTGYVPAELYEPIESELMRTAGDDKKPGANATADASLKEALAGINSAAGLAKTGKGLFDMFSSSGAGEGLASGGADAMGGMGGGAMDMLGSGMTFADGGKARHTNEWMKYPGQAVGTVIGSMYGGPWGGMAGGQAGKSAGTLFGDVTGGNWDGAGQDVVDELKKGLSMAKSGPPGMGGGGGGSPMGDNDPLSMLLATVDRDPKAYGGRAGLAAGGGMPYSSGDGYIPDELIEPKEPEKAEPPPAPGAGGQQQQSGKGGVGGALKGAASGAMSGMAMGPWGALAGGVLGGLSSLFNEGGRVGLAAGGGVMDEDEASRIALEGGNVLPFARPSTVKEPEVPSLAIPKRPEPVVEAPAGLAAGPAPAPSAGGVPTLPDGTPIVDTPPAASPAPPAGPPVVQQAKDMLKATQAAATPGRKSETAYDPKNPAGYTQFVFGGESNGKDFNNPNWPTARGGPDGPGQFIPGTWQGFVNARPDLFAGKSPAEVDAMRKNPELSAMATDWYANKNAGPLQQAGVPLTYGNLAMAHMLDGPVAATFLSNPGMNAFEALKKAGLSDGQARATLTQNGGSLDMTAGQFAQMHKDRMDGAKSSPRQQVSALNAGPAAGGGGDQTGLAAGQSAAPAADKPVPDFIDRAGNWIERNQRPIMSGLAFIGNMLGSKSHQLAGAIGDGLAAAAPMYLNTGYKEQELGQSQQRINITGRAQLISVMEQLKAMQSANIAAGSKPNPDLDTQIADIAKQIRELGGASAAPGRTGGTGGTGGVMPPARPAPERTDLAPQGTPAGGSTAPVTSAPLPPPEGAAPPGSPTPASNVKDPYAMPAPDFANAGFRARIHPDMNPDVLRKRAETVAALNPAEAGRLRNQATQLELDMRKTGQTTGVDGNPLNVPGFFEAQAAEKRMQTNPQFAEEQRNIAAGRERLKQQVNLLKDLTNKYESGALNSVWADADGKLKALGLPGIGGGSAANYQQFMKEASAVMLAQSQSMPSGHGPTDALRQQISTSFAAPTLDPEANRKILANTMGLINWADKNYTDTMNELEKKPWLDTRRFYDDWTKQNELQKFTKDADKETTTAGMQVPKSVAELEDGRMYNMTPQDVFRLMRDNPTMRDQIKIDDIKQQFGGKPNMRLRVIKTPEGKLRLVPE